MAESSRFGITRRRLLIGGGVGAGLLVGWTLWPRHYTHNLVAGEGEEIFNAYLKIGEEGRISVVVPQAEMGQGVWTALPQALADELGADWRTVGVEPSPINPLYANDFLIAEGAGQMLPEFLGEAGRWAAREYAVRNSLMLTGGSSSIRGFELRFREAGAAAAASLCRAAAARWDVDWRECDTRGGFVVHGDRQLRFGELAATAATLEPPGEIALRAPADRVISGQAVPRIDLPSKVDGSARYAGDVRLPDMLFASAIQAPSPRHRLRSVAKEAADAVSGVTAIIENPRFVACAATNWWAANRGVTALEPIWEGGEEGADDGTIGEALEAALDGEEGVRFIERGDLAAAFGESGAHRVTYEVGFAPHASIEPLTATARASAEGLEIWAPAQAPGLMREAIARATGFAGEDIAIYPMLIGGAFGRKVEHDAAVQAAIIARRLGRPVQLTWSREEETRSDYMRPAARGRLTGKLSPDGRISVLHSRIAVPSAGNQLAARIMPGLAGSGAADDADRGAVEGAAPAYAIPNLAIEHMPVDYGVACGIWRSVAHSYTAFFTESFVDELARLGNFEPLAFRIGMLGQAPRLARCLTSAAQLAEWDGGQQGGGMGIAAHSSFGSHVAMVVQLHIDEAQRPVLERVVAAVDCGRIINPEIVRQQIEGGIVFGVSAALGAPVGYEGGEPTVRNFDAMGLPRLADTPRIEVELIDSTEEPGGVGEIAVPPVAPAIGNAIYAATGQRLRRLPFLVGGVA